MKRNLGSSSTIASPAVGRKSLNMISTTGRNPVTAIPIAAPINVFSQIGVFVTLPGNFSGNPVFVLKTPPSIATSSPRSNTRGSERISSSRAAPTASR